MWPTELGSTLGGSTGKGRSAKVSLALKRLQCRNDETSHNARGALRDEERRRWGRWEQTRRQKEARPLTEGPERLANQDKKWVKRGGERRAEHEWMRRQLHAANINVRTSTSEWGGANKERTGEELFGGIRSLFKQWTTESGKFRLNHHRRILRQINPLKRIWEGREGFSFEAAVIIRLRRGVVPESRSISIISQSRVKEPKG